MGVEDLRKHPAAPVGVVAAAKRATAGVEPIKEYSGPFQIHTFPQLATIISMLVFLLVRLGGFRASITALMRGPASFFGPPY